MPSYKTEWSSIHTLKPIIFWSSRKHKVTFDLYTEAKPISIPTIKSSQLCCRDTKTKKISVYTLKPIFPDPYTKTKYTPIPSLISSEVQYRT